MTSKAVVTLVGELARRMADIIAKELQGRGLAFVLVLVDPESEHHVVRSNLDTYGADEVLKQVRQRLVEARVTVPDAERD